MRVLVVLGRSSPAGRLRAVVRTAVDRAGDRLDVTASWVDLAHLHIAETASFGGEEDGEAVLRELASADAVVVAAEADGGLPAAALRRLLDRTSTELTQTPVGLVVAGATLFEREAAGEALRAGVVGVGGRPAPTVVAVSTTATGLVEDADELDGLFDTLDAMVHQT